MNKPVLSIDVSKLNSHATAFLGYGKPFKKSFKFNHTPDDLNALLKWLVELEEITNYKPQIVLEATGNFSKPIKQFFIDSNYEVVELNPLQTHRIKKKKVRKVKTDLIDTHRIAQAYYLEGSSSQYVPPAQISELRNLCRQYDGLNVLYTETQQRFRSIVDLIFPQYDTVFANLCSLSSIHVLAAYPTPEDVLSATETDLKEILKIAKKGQTWTDKTIIKLRIAAKESLPYNEAKQSSTQVLQNYVQILLTQQNIITGLYNQIERWAEELPVYPLLLSIPGVGVLTAATVIGEIGDINRFPTTKHLTAFAGLDPAIYESGKYKSRNNKISKRGSTYLRKYLYMATIAGARKGKNGPINPILHDFYNKKLNEGKLKKVARTATANKLLRIIYGIWKNQQPFHVK